jgi:hypothetical protein
MFLQWPELHDLAITDPPLPVEPGAREYGTASRGPRAIVRPLDDEVGPSTQDEPMGEPERARIVSTKRERPHTP